MATLRFDDFENDTIVLHFGGAEGSIDAYTLAEALIGFADMSEATSGFCCTNPAYRFAHAGYLLR